MGCLPCGNLQPEVAHLNACYPPGKALLTAGPEYRPLAQDLSKLTYFATNKPSKLAKIGEELEKRVSKESQKATAGYPKFRASLLISLAILRAILTECKRDIALFARSALKAVDRSLEVRVYQHGGVDLEVVSRAAAAFIAFTTYTDGLAIGVDDTLTKTYFDILRKFGKLAGDITTDTSEKPDLEFQNRTRLVGLAGLHGAAVSDTMFSSTRDLSYQLALIIHPLLDNIFEGPMAELKIETVKIDTDASPSPFFSEFSAHAPTSARRAPSLHLHIPGEKGPAVSDVLSAALRTLHALVQRSNVTQTSLVVDQLGHFLDKKGWKDTERCCWLAEKLTAWITLQYRIVVPTRLVEVLANSSDGPVTVKHSSAIAMVTTVLNSTISLVGLGVSDLLQNLVSVIIRRIHVDSRDMLLSSLVQCVGSLGTHIYYADQINDTVEELALRIAEIPPSDKDRSEIIRVLTCCIIGVMLVADAADDKADNRITSSSVSTAPTHMENTVDTKDDKGKSPASPPETPLPASFFDSPHMNLHRSSRRNPISPQVWQETLPLLCEADYAIRSAYARALLLFLETELPRESINGKAEREPRPQLDPGIYRFCNALNAAIYTLVMSSCLGVEEKDVTTAPPTVRTSPGSGHSPDSIPNTEPFVVEKEQSQSSGRGTPRGDRAVSFKVNDIGEDGPSGMGAYTPSKRNYKPRRVSLPLSRLQSYTRLSSFDNVATPLDFSAVLRILDALHLVRPTIALQTGAPMLLALDKDAGNELIRKPGDERQGAWVVERKRAIRELVALLWRRIAERWGVVEVDQLANKALASIPEPFLIPALPPPPPADILLPSSDPPVAFIPHILEGESSSTAKPLLNPSIIIDALKNAKTIQIATQKDEHELEVLLSNTWSVENAVKDSVERFSSARIRPAEDDAHYHAAASLLMSMNNASYQSVSGQRGSKVVDITDLRDALGGRVDSISLSGVSAISQGTEDLFHASSNGNKLGQAPVRQINDGSDVREVLKDIFREKKKKDKIQREATTAKGINVDKESANTHQNMNVMEGPPAKVNDDELRTNLEQDSKLFASFSLEDPITVPTNNH
ncbi:uncharacterized protein L203_105429 [Cryptococcus depauperatus CBS 7841]|uniref:Uncharacterized protein n=1 Tax=Cryptococcus depauperatus CBS 7841 TaxID=1295531 RepID=A0A1E3ICQ8_9TREE|nr:protein EFR3 [Cryptococcus depauperatus CBS 7841]